MKIIFKGNPLSTQTIYRIHCRGKFAVLYMTKRGKERKKQYQSEARNQYKGKVISTDCDMKMILFFQTKRDHDVDNFSKLVLDALEGIVFENDKQVQELHTKKDYSKEDPRIEIEINGRVEN